MTHATRSWRPETFQRLYAADPDPWHFSTSAYERAKYAASLAALHGRRFGDALEIGCSIGVFTARLARRCRRLLAVDGAQAAVDAASRNCARQRPVRIERRQMPGQWPRGRFDLIVVSEVLYFLDPADIDRLARRATASLRPGGLVLLVNWTGPTDTPTTGQAAATRFTRAAAHRLHKVRRLRRPGYRLDLLRARA